MVDHVQYSAVMDGTVQAPIAPGIHEIEKLFQTIDPLTGTSMKILLLMLISSRSYSAQRLRQVTGISRKTLRRSMGQLAFAGAVCNDGSRRWRISHPWRAFLSISIVSGQLAEIEKLASQQPEQLEQSWAGPENDLPAEPDMPAIQELGSDAEAGGQVSAEKSHGRQANVSSGNVDRALRSDHQLQEQLADAARSGDDTRSPLGSAARPGGSSGRQEARKTPVGVAPLEAAGCHVRPAGIATQLAVNSVRQRVIGDQSGMLAPGATGNPARLTETIVLPADHFVPGDGENDPKADTNASYPDKNIQNGDGQPVCQANHHQSTIVVKELSDKKRYKQQHQTKPVKQTMLSEHSDQGRQARSHEAVNGQPENARDLSANQGQADLVITTAKARPEDVTQLESDRQTGATGTECKAQESDETRDQNKAGPVAPGVNQADKEAVKAQHAARRERKKILARFLKRAGILGSAFSELLLRQDLQLDPRPVLAWWWYALAQEKIRNPAALAIRCLQRNDPPPAGFMELVSFWPRVSSSHRGRIEEMIQRNWSAEELVRNWQRHYPEATSRAFVAMKELYLEQPDALGYR